MKRAGSRRREIRFCQCACLAFELAAERVSVLLVLWGLFIVYATLLPFDFSASGT